MPTWFLHCSAWSRFYQLKFKNCEFAGDQDHIETRACEVGALGSWPLHLRAVSHVARTTNNVYSEVIECRILQLVKVLGV